MSKLQNRLNLSAVRRRKIILFFLFGAAFLIRLYRLTLPPFNFEPERQYRSALIARHFYFAQNRSIPEWRREVIAAEKIGAKEPLITQYLGYLSYRLAGGEHLWLPRLLAVIFWMIGGVFCYLTAQKLFAFDGAIFATSYYLFFPFGIFASRSFQPEPLMIMMFLASIFTIVRYYEQPTMSRLLVAAIVCAGGIIVKFVTVFAIEAAFVFMGIFTRSLKKRDFWGSLLLFTAVSLAPGLGYYCYMVFFSQSIMWVAEQNFLPHLLGESFFWKGWLKQISRVVGYLPCAAGLLGIFWARRRCVRGLLAGLWAGFIVFGMIFPYGVHIVPYWSLQIGPIVALSLGTWGDLLGRQLRRLAAGWRWALAGIGGVAIGLLVAVAFTITPQKTKNLNIPLTVKNKIEVLCQYLGIPTELARNINTDYTEKINIARAIGKEVDHSTKTVFLTYNYGAPLKYYAEIAGKSWPQSGDFRAMRMQGVRVVEAAQRFTQDYAVNEPEFFVITEMQEFEKQKDLQSFLFGNFPLLAQNQDYLIFDLRTRLNQDK